MTISPPLVRNVRRVAIITGCWTLISALLYVNTYLLIGDIVQLGYLSGTYPFAPDFAGNVVVGAFGGLVGGSLLVFKVNAGYKHRSFLSGIVYSVTLFVLIYIGSAGLILFALAFARYSLEGGLLLGLQSGWNNVLINFRTPSFIVGMATWGILVSATQFMLQVNDKFGAGVLWKMLKGTYHHPREEERIFMFLDLKSSTSIAEAIGHRRFFELLAELFQDITLPVLDCLGEIYQYVGDEVVLSWTVENGRRGGNCIRCFFEIERAIERRGTHYVERYGRLPQFKAGLHVGEATVGEIGVLKKDIVYSGDVLNTTSRIQEECNRRQVTLLASSALLAILPETAPYDASPIGEIGLRGKADAITLSAIAPS